MLPDNDTGISMTPLDEHEQNTQFGAGRAAMLATRPAVQNGGYTRGCHRLIDHALRSASD